jgi:hypothetical protein
MGQSQQFPTSHRSSPASRSSGKTVIRIPSPEPPPSLLSWCVGGTAGERAADYAGTSSLLSLYTSTFLFSLATAHVGDFYGGSRLMKEAGGRRIEGVVWAVSLA